MNTATATAYDFGPILRALIEAAATIISIIAVPLFWAGWSWLQNHTKLSAIQVSEAQRARIDEGLQKAIGYGIAVTSGAADSLATSGRLTVDLHSPVAVAAVKYAFDHFPGDLKAAGVTPEMLAEMAKSRIGMMTASAATAPVTMAAATSSAPSPQPAGA